MARILVRAVSGLLFGISCAFTTLAHASLCGDMFERVGPEFTLRAFDSSPPFKSLPTDLNLRVQDALRSVLYIGSPNVNPWNSMAIAGLRLTELPEADLRRLVEKRLTEVAALFTNVPSDIRLLQPTSDSHSAVHALMAKLKVSAEKTTFAQNHGLEGFRSVVEKQQSLFEAPEALASYGGGTSFEVAFDLANAIGKSDIAESMIVRSIYLRSYRTAIKMAERLKAESALNMAKGNELLLRISQVALADYFLGAHRPAVANDVIAGLQRIDGPLQAQAARLLQDFADELLSPSRIRQIQFETKQSTLVVEEKSGDLALRALRSIGTFEKSIVVDSIETNIVKRVSDEAVKERIVNLLTRFQGSPETSYAVYAIGGADLLRDRARSRIEMLDLATYFDGVEGDRRELEESLTLLGDPGLNEQYVRKTLSLAPFAKQGEKMNLYRTAMDFLRVQGSEKTRGILRADMIRFGAYLRQVSQDRNVKIRRRIMLESLAELRGQANPQPDAFRISWLVENEKLMRKELERALKSSPEARHAERDSALRAFEKGSHAKIYEGFIAAADRDGLIRLGDQMMKEGANLEALRPYLAASLLVPRK